MDTYNRQVGATRGSMRHPHATSVMYNRNTISLDLLHAPLALCSETTMSSVRVKG